MSSSIPPPQTQQNQNDTMKAYYTFHAKIYDLTRWTFLFGRKAIVKYAATKAPNAKNILEVGCGTGKNLQTLVKNFRQAHITGLDVSGAMLAKARRKTSSYRNKVKLVEGPYQLGDSSRLGEVDLILFSYSLSMINPQWEDLLRQAHKDLKPGGIIAIADFYDSPFPWFKSHMGNNHVRMDGHMMPLLSELFQTEVEKISHAYLGLWKYFQYVGRKI